MQHFTVEELVQEGGVAGGVVLDAAVSRGVVGAGGMTLSISQEIAIRPLRRFVVQRKCLAAVFVAAALSKTPSLDGRTGRILSRIHSRSTGRNSSPVPLSQSPRYCAAAFQLYEIQLLYWFGEVCVRAEVRKDGGVLRACRLLAFSITRRISSFGMRVDKKGRAVHHSAERTH